LMLGLEGGVNDCSMALDPANTSLRYSEYYPKNGSGERAIQPVL